MSFKDLQPKTKQMVIVAVTLVTLFLIIAAALTGNLDLLLNLVGGAIDPLVDANENLLPR